MTWDGAQIPAGDAGGGSASAKRSRERTVTKTRGSLREYGGSSAIARSCRGSPILRARAAFVAMSLCDVGGSTLVLSGASPRYRSCPCFYGSQSCPGDGTGRWNLWHRTPSPSARSLLASPFARGLTRLTLLGVSTVFCALHGVVCKTQLCSCFRSIRCVRWNHRDRITAVFAKTVATVALCWLAAVVSLVTSAYAHVFANSIYTLAPIGYLRLVASLQID